MYKYILKYYRLISNNNNGRSNSTILKSYNETFEETCVDILSFKNIFRQIK